MPPKFASKLTHAQCYSALTSVAIALRGFFACATESNERLAKVASAPLLAMMRCLSFGAASCEKLFKEAYAARVLHDHVGAVFQLAC
jgi:hypothetical protein